MSSVQWGGDHFDVPNVGYALENGDVWRYYDSAPESQKGDERPLSLDGQASYLWAGLRASWK